MITYEQVAAYMAAKCAEASLAANNDTTCVKIEAWCINGKIEVNPVVYTKDLGHIGNVHPHLSSLDEGIKQLREKFVLEMEAA